MADAPRLVSQGRCSRTGRRRVPSRTSPAGFSTDLAILAAGLAVAVGCVLVLPGAGSLQAQDPGQPALPTAVPPPPAFKTEEKVKEPQPAPAVQPSGGGFSGFGGAGMPLPGGGFSMGGGFAGGPMPPMMMPPSAQRFQFKIEANTPVKDLLPEAPKAERRAGPLFQDDLFRVPELAFQAAQPDVIGPKALEKTAHQIAKINHLNRKKSDAFMEALLASRPDLAGLPFAMGEACRTKGERTRQFNLALNTVRQALQGSSGFTQVMQEVQQVQEKDGKTFVVRRAVAVPVPVSVPQTQTGNPNQDPAARFWDAYHQACDREDRQNGSASREQQEHVTQARIAALVQVLGPESLGLRQGLVKYLSAVAHPEATRQLARLALFSAEAEVRQPAIDALKVRRERDYTDILVQGLRYPWPAVARRASEAIVQLERQDLLPQLLAVLEEADPRLPVTREVDGKQVATVRELVRLNHHKNCLMCHAPGNTPGVSPEAVTAQVPVPGEPLPTPSTGYQNSIPDVLVRVDVTYLRQDFSMRLPVADASPWPEMQRFDFLVRTRALSEDEARAYREQAEKREPGVLSPYHRAALAALRELTGRDTEPTAQAWRRLLNLPAPRADDTP